MNINIIYNMPNSNGGKKYKRQKKTGDVLKRPVRFKKEEEVAEVYGLVTKVLGSCRFSIHCCDGKERIGQLRSGMKKSVRIKKDDWVLVGLRTFETTDSKCDILCKYFPEEVAMLRKNNEPLSFGALGLVENEKKEEVDENVAFDFEDI